MKYLPLILCLFLMGAKPQAQIVFDGERLVKTPDGEVETLDPYDYHRWAFQKEYFKNVKKISSEKVNEKECWIVEFETT